MKYLNLKITQTKLVFHLSIFYVIFYNFCFFGQVFSTFGLTFKSIFFELTLALVLASVINILFNLIRVRVIFKPLMIITTLAASMAAYFMDIYKIAIDEEMLVNISRTNFREAVDLLSFKMLIYFILLGLIPSYFIYNTQIIKTNLKKDLKDRGIALIVSLIVIAVSVVAFSKNYATFLREFKPLRYYTNPTYFIYSSVRFGQRQIATDKEEFNRIGLGAKIGNRDQNRKLVIFVLGETARGDHFSLNGYERKTNPHLEMEKVISFKNMTSCGTSTAISVPCLFSHLKRTGFDRKKANNTENLLDILNHTGDIDILWRDNNSSSKGVADRINYQDYTRPEVNTICTPECRDEGMLVGLQEYINQVKKIDIFIVIHQMGNHGPAYYKRYPAEFEKFKPVCKTNQLEKCSKEEIINAYDNALLYTDYFLKKVIDLLKANPSFDTSMFYVSDHGESLGENGVYLHSLPYFMAPMAQKHVGGIFWFGEKMQPKVNTLMLLKRADTNDYNHDYIMHTFLGLFDVVTPIYNSELDLLNGIRK